MLVAFSFCPEHEDDREHVGRTLLSAAFDFTFSDSFSG